LTEVVEPSGGGQVERNPSVSEGASARPAQRALSEACRCQALDGFLDELERKRPDYGQSRRGDYMSAGFAPIRGERQVHSVYANVPASIGVDEETSGSRIIRKELKSPIRPARIGTNRAAYRERFVASVLMRTTSSFTASDSSAVAVRVSRCSSLPRLRRALSAIC